MTIRKVLLFPDPRLREISTPIETFDDALQTLIDDMFETMYEHNGVGLAAPQIDEQIQLIVIDASEDRDQPHILINPEILEQSDMAEELEGCISFPGIFEKTTRATKITFKALDRQGKPYKKTVDGLFAWCVQHEIDHLNGRLLVDLVSPLKKNRILKKMQKLRKMTM